MTLTEMTCPPELLPFLKGGHRSYREVLQLWEEANPRPEMQCAHHRTDIRYIIDSLGRRMYSHQCLVCGSRVTPFIPKPPEFDMCEPWDRKFETACSDRMRTAILGLWDEYRATRQSLWRLYYNNYLQSPEWEARRRNALRSADNCCERCRAISSRKVPAVEVHHLHYRTLGEEEPEDIAAVCAWCHREIHAKVFTI